MFHAGTVTVMVRLYTGRWKTENRKQLLRYAVDLLGRHRHCHHGVHRGVPRLAGSYFVRHRSSFVRSIVHSLVVCCRGQESERKHRPNREKSVSAAATNITQAHAHRLQLLYHRTYAQAARTFCFVIDRCWCSGVWHTSKRRGQPPSFCRLHAIVESSCEREEQEQHDLIYKCINF